MRRRPPERPGVPRRNSKRTTPSTLAKRVSSEPMPTLRPAANLVPRWRTSTEPAVTFSLAKAFTPRRWPWESRPLEEDPCDFVCAMGLGPRLDGFDEHFRQGLTVALEL